MIETLIEKLESAKEGSEELDREINEVLGWKHLPPYKLGLRRFKERWIKGIETSWFVPRYTTSVDEAMALVPKKSTLDLGQSFCGEWWDASIYSAVDWEYYDRDRRLLGDTASGMDSAAMAICIASLKARIKNNDT